jgi:hypothetical protein
MNIRLCAAPLLALALVACDKDTDTDTGGEVGCTTESRASVTVTVTDAEGAEISDATLTYSVDGSAAQPCEGTICGEEIAGELTITASARGYSDASEIVTVEGDICHVTTEELTLALEPVDCTQVVVTSFIVTVTDEGDAPIDLAQVSYAPASGDGDEATCVSGDDALSHVHFCGEEEIGTFDYVVTADGYDTASGTVVVELDDDSCHPATEELTVKLPAAR